MFLLDKIILYSKGRTLKIELPRVKDIEVGGDTVYKETQMASGRKVRDIVGFRVSVKASWEWLPAETIKRVHELLRSGQYIYAEYPDPVKGKGEGLFDISYPESKIFKFNGTEPRWYGITLTMAAQEVEQ